ncbi:MAG: hypothetical protein ABW065_10305 [Solirubrobacterales bacterium]
MRERGGASRLLSLAVVVLAMAFAAPAAATAATVVNGDFETGNLQGWHAQSATGFGNWYVYEGTKPPISEGGRGTAPVPAPPQGKHAAIADQLDPDTLVLYQDISLAAAAKHQLSLQAFYSSNKPLALPTPDTLSTDPSVIGEQANQQFRIDLMKPEAGLESIDPNDVLRTIFSTQPGDPVAMPPTRLTANLTSFAGQTVRLRIVVAAGKEALNGGIDDVSVVSTPGAGSAGPGAGGTGGKGGKGGSGGNGGAAGPGSRLRVLGSAKSLANGGAILRVRLPDAGRLTAKRPKLLVPASAETAQARVVSLPLKPTAKALRILRDKGRLRFKLALAFDPRDSGAIQRATPSVLLELASPRRP